MHVANCTVHLRGEESMAIPKRGVSVPEIEVLQHIHGEGSVRNVEFAGNVHMQSHREEKARLCRLYRTHVVEAVYPGVSPNFPTKLKQIGIGAGDDDDDSDTADEKPKRGPGRPPKSEG